MKSETARSGRHRRSSFRQSLRILFSAFFAAIFIASCTHGTRTNDQNSTRNFQHKFTETEPGQSQQFWTGRLSIRIDTEPVQRLSSAFELSGTPQVGQLRLLTPLGAIVGELNWSPTVANWSDGRSTRSSAHVDTLLISQTGMTLPLSALFAWMSGQAHTEPGWFADLSLHALGRVTITRAAATDPKQPSAELRIAINQN